MYLIELALTGDCRSELNDLSEDLSLLGLQNDSVELQGGSVDFSCTSESVEGVTDLSPGVSHGFFTASESTERIVSVLESELVEEATDLSLRTKSRDSECMGVFGLTARLDVIESGPIVSPELNDLVLSGVFGLRLASS